MEARKRIRLDSEDEDDNAGNGAQRIERETTPVSSPVAAPQQTPRKGEAGDGNVVATPVKGQVPVIQIQGPTPRKEPAPTPRRSLRKGDRAADFVPPGTVPEDDAETPAEHQGSAGESDGVTSDQGDGLKVDETAPADENDAAPPALARSDSSMIIPSPATEDDPPEFDVVLKPQPTVPSASAAAVAPLKAEPGPSGEEASVAHDGPVRILRPTSSFSSFMLWTADAPLAGFRREEEKPVSEGKDEEKPHSASGEIEDSAAPVGAPEESADAKLRQGWWSQGGGGEGGDEVVRALGEWLGLVETVSPLCDVA